MKAKRGNKEAHFPLGTGIKKIKRLGKKQKEK